MLGRNNEVISEFKFTLALVFSGKLGLKLCMKEVRSAVGSLFPPVTGTWRPHFTFSNLCSLPATHCHGRLKPKIKFTILGESLLNGTLGATDFEKTDGNRL